ncbi:MAG: type I 3-dehydroquinate dehydratase [Methermicoccaceae archaeon]
MVVQACSIVGVVSSLEDLGCADAELADILELRLDLLTSSLGQVLDAVASVQKPVIATCRPRMEGGGFSGSELEREKLLCEAVGHVDMVDVELAFQRTREHVVEHAREVEVEVIVSHHDFAATPPLSKILELFCSELDSGADIAKVAVMPSDVGDTLVLLDAVRTMSARGSVCGISMGEIGKPTRLLSSFYGSVLTYGFLQSVAAPGQLSVSALYTGFKMLGLREG